MQPSHLTATAIAGAINSLVLGSKAPFFLLRLPMRKRPSWYPGAVLPVGRQIFAGPPRHPYNFASLLSPNRVFLKSSHNRPDSISTHFDVLR